MLLQSEPIGFIQDFCNKDSACNKLKGTVLRRSIGELARVWLNRPLELVSVDLEALIDSYYTDDISLASTDVVLFRTQECHDYALSPLYHMEHCLYYPNGPEIVTSHTHTLVYLVKNHRYRHDLQIRRRPIRWN